MDTSIWWPYVAGLLPSIGIGWIFYKIMKALVEADRNERQAVARMDAEDRRRAEAETAANNEAPSTSLS